MGQKVRPISLRLGITEPFRSQWYARKGDFGKYLVEDQKIRRYIKRNYYYAGIPKVEIERTGDNVRVIINTARPGLIIGRKGAEVERLKSNIEELTGRTIDIVIKEVNKPELEAQLVAEGVAQQLEKRAAFRKVLRRASETALEAGAKGVKIQVSGRLGGSEMSRTEHVSLGSVPLHTIMADISYGFAEARTTYGQIGCKAWVYRGLTSAFSEEMKALRTNEETEEEQAHGADA